MNKLTKKVRFVRECKLSTQDGIASTTFQEHASNDKLCSFVVVLMRRLVCSPVSVALTLRCLMPSNNSSGRRKEDKTLAVQVKDPRLVHNAIACWHFTRNFGL